MEHIQTLQKPKPKSNRDSDEWFAQDNDEDSLSQPFEKIDMFVLEDPQNGRPVEDHLTLIEAFLEGSTKD